MSWIRNTTLILVTLSFALAFADKNSNHLRDVSCDNYLQTSSQDDVLLAELHARAAAGHQQINYSYRTVIFNDYDTHHTIGATAVDVYCHETYKLPADLATIDRIVNIEHTWPKSRFSGRYPRGLQKTDLHHLFITDSGANSTRSSFPFGNVTKVKNKPCEGSLFGSDDEGRIVFEPPNDQKGATARAIFYFAVRYELAISPQEEAVLRQWNRDFPPTAADKLRNDKIEALQGNRNPFIDDSTLVDRVKRFD